MENATNQHLDKTNALLHDELKVINIGSILFADAMRTQGVQVAHVAWQPPASGDAELVDLLKDLL